MRDPLYPLTLFYEQTGDPLPTYERIDGAAIPQPQRSLLVHDRDMTPTLEAHYKDRIQLAPLVVQSHDTSIMRQVVLYSEKYKTPVEFGAIWINLALLESGPAEQVRSCSAPLGAILHDHQIPHASQPSLFLQIQPDELICHSLAIDAPTTLYGRQNSLTTPDGETIADVLEILAPKGNDSP